jgi:hypothetical protein
MAPLLFSLALLAQAAPGAGDPAGNSVATRVEVGQLVEDSQGATLGRIEAVKTAPDGRARQVLVRVGGVRGVGASTKALPAAALRPKGDGHAAVLTRAEVESLPEVAH